MDKDLIPFNKENNIGKVFKKHEFALNFISVSYTSVIYILTIAVLFIIIQN